ncbi:MAG: CinA family protein [Bacilli bacterium]|jgi:PncC family amidohydrolase|nr:CinA family protein [Bacilli bacterium]
MKAQKLVEILKSKNLTIGAVESMTGGLFASSVTDVPGASEIFRGGIVAYNSGLKCDLVNVRKSTIDEFGVVSWEVASEMAYNGRSLINVDFCIAVTGNAGPTASDTKKDIGVVYLAIASKDNVWGVPLNLKGSRVEIKKQAVDLMISTLESILK